MSDIGRDAGWAGGFPSSRRPAHVDPAERVLLQPLPAFSF